MHLSPKMNQERRGINTRAVTHPDAQALLFLSRQLRANLQQVFNKHDCNTFIHVITTVPASTEKNSHLTGVKDNILHTLKNLFHYLIFGCATQLLSMQ